MTKTRALLLVLALAGSAAALEVPPLQGRVNDRAGMLPPAAAAALESKLAAFQSRTGHQFAVLTLPSLEGEPLEPYALKVIRSWGLGRKGVNDGILLLIAKNDRKLRIEVGHGLEGALPDALAGRIISGVITPRFKEGDFAGGIQSGADAIMTAAQGEYIPPPRAAPPRDDGFAHFFFLAMMILVYAEIHGLTEPGGPGFYYLGLMPAWLMVVRIFYGTKIGLFAMLVHAIAFPLLRVLIPYRRDYGETWPLFGASGSSPDFLSSSSSSSFSSGGPDFSGGGGSSGGGGASGSW